MEGGRGGHYGCVCKWLFACVRASRKKNGKQQKKQKPLQKKRERERASLRTSLPFILLIRQMREGQARCIRRQRFFCFPSRAIGGKGRANGETVECADKGRNLSSQYEWLFLRLGHLDIRKRFRLGSVWLLHFLFSASDITDLEGSKWAGRKAVGIVGMRSLGDTQK